MEVIDSYSKAIKLRQKTPDEIQDEMDNPKNANFSVYDYHLPNGVVYGVGKSEIPSHAGLYQLKVVDYNGFPNIKPPSKYRGEYTSASRAEEALLLYCKEAWAEAESSKSKQVRKSEKLKNEQVAV